MNIIHPLHLIDIQEALAAHVEWRDLPSCMLVCHSWRISFRPFLWRTVVVSSLGPDFSDTKAQALLRHTRDLDFRWLPDSPLPILSFPHLTSLKISPVRLDITNKHPLHPFWTSITDIILALGASNTHLSSLELHLLQGTTDFWRALLTCTSLNSLTLSNLHIDRTLTYSFWRVASTVESITLRNATTEAHSHPFRPLYRTPFVRLRHLVLKGSSSLRWLNGGNLPWLRAPNLETIRCSSPRAIAYMDITNLALEIKAATEAAAAGILFYGPRGAENSVDYDRGQFYDPWHGGPTVWVVEDPDAFEQYRGIVPGKRIREFECVLPYTVSPHAMAVVVGNMDALERFVVHGLKEAMQALAPLEQHVETLVELDIRDCDLMSEKLVVFLEQCPRLQPFLPELGEALEHLLERLAEFERLERFYMPEYWHRYGLDCLRRLTQVRDVQFTSTSVKKLSVVDAGWMVQHWPELTMVRIPVGDTDSKTSFEAMSVLTDHGVECLFHVGRHASDA
ncbi:hypothetical protein BGZ81_008634 [Podila clonocystis]|nr:hypothetical protein BGZ81_008634 [Podila clonocystis]